MIIYSFLESEASKKEAGSGATDAQIVSLAFERLAVSFGKKILAIVPKRVSTEVDTRLAFDTDGTIAKAQELIGQYEGAGISRERILIKIPSTPRLIFLILCHRK